MKRSLLVAALSLMSTSVVWAAEPTPGDVAILAQQVQQTALLQSIDQKLTNPSDGVPAIAAISGVSPVGQTNAVTAIDASKAATFYGDQHTSAIPSRLTDHAALTPRGVVMVTVEVFEKADGKESMAHSFSIMAVDRQAAQLFSGETVPYTSFATNDLDKDGKPIPPTVKTLDIGTTVRLVPRLVASDHALLSLDINQSHLVSMQKFSASNGLSVDLPTTRESSQSQSMTMKVGESLNLGSTDGRIVIRLDRIDQPTEQAAR